MATTKFTGSHGTVEVKPGKGRMHGRHCVIGRKHKVNPHAKGIHKSPLLVGGCYGDKTAAVAKAKKLAGPAK